MITGNAFSQSPSDQSAPSAEIVEPGEAWCPGTSQGMAGDSSGGAYGMVGRSWTLNMVSDGFKQKMPRMLWGNSSPTVTVEI